MKNPTATLLISCPDQKGLVAQIASFIYSYGGNIIHSLAIIPIFTLFVKGKI
jgi:formyltetrahydrofolate deformylase